MSEKKPVRPCRVCGGLDKTSTGQCQPCKRRRQKAWSEANAERERARKAAAYRADRDAWIARAVARNKALGDVRRAYLREWTEKNRERSNGYSTAWRERNRDKRKQVLKAWAQRNPEKVRISRSNRRARVVNAVGKFSQDLVPRLLRLQRRRCACCGLPLGRKYELDHIVPLALGGTNEDSNAQLLRDVCNRRKAARHPIEYMQSKGLLL